MNISLRPIDHSNRNACVALSVTEAQSALIAPNAKSLAWADANSDCVALAIEADGEIVGFALYEPRGNDIFSVHRFMIDRRYQRKGLGLRAMHMMMERILAYGGVTIYLSFRPENIAARKFYEKLGFEFHEEEPDGELVYRYGPKREIENS